MRLAANELMLAVGGSLAASILVKVTVTTAFALVGARLARRSRASVRHILLAASFAVLLALPIASVFAPPVRIAIPIAARPGTVSPPFEAATNVVLPRTTEIAGAIAVPAIPRSPRFPLSTFLFAGWLAGTMLFLLPVAAGLWQTRSLRRSGLPWRHGQSVVDRLAIGAGVRRRVEALLHESVPGPMTCGIVHPAIMLPVDAQTWTDEELSRAVVHELEHVRRSDWISRCLARAVCAGYWFHPLVWVSWRQFVLEAERACDDAVLRRAEATAYADQLVVLARRLLTASNPPLLAMANRYDLAKRVAALLDSRQRRGRAGALCVGFACAASALVVTAISPLHIVAGAQNQPAADTRKFDVASIKPCDADSLPDTGQRRAEFTVSPGRATIECLTVERIVYFAYAGIGNLNHPLLNDHPSNPTHVRGGPGWIRSDRFTIIATAEGTSDRQVIMGPMLRALLEERFHLKTHRDTEEVPMYALTVAKGGLKIQPIGEGGCTAPGTMQDLSQEARLALSQGPKPPCGNFTSLGDSVNGNWFLGGESLSKFANQTLSAVLDRYVIDKTDVTGLFNIHLHFGFDDNINPGVFGGRPSLAYSAENPPPPGIEKEPSIFTALEDQLGLKLEKTKAPREFLVIDSAERPAGM